MGLSHLKVDRVKTLVDGAAAGDITVTGITTNDRLASVIYIAATLANSEDLTSEFSITAANTINNTGGTATTGGVLIVEYDNADPRGGDLNRS